MNQTHAVMLGEMMTRDLYDRVWWQPSSRRHGRSAPTRARWSLRLARPRRTRLATA